jgi:ribosomal protein S18 acetylase RimI-like enzyme
MDRIAVEPHRHDDRRFVRAMLEVGVRETYTDLATLGRVSARERLDEIFEGHWEHPEKVVLVARGDGGAPLGVVWLEPSHHGVTELPEYMFVLLAVVEGHRGRGLGRRLMEAAIAHVAAAGGRRARLFVGAGNERARALYARLGFAERTVEMQWDAPGP